MNKTKTGLQQAINDGLKQLIADLQTQGAPNEFIEAFAASLANSLSSFLATLPEDLDTLSDAEAEDFSAKLCEILAVNAS